jgi:hypothetical protein
MKSLKSTLEYLLLPIIFLLKLNKQTNLLALFAVLFMLSGTQSFALTMPGSGDDDSTTNTAPIAEDDDAYVGIDTPTTIDVLSNDSDEDDDTLAITDITTPSHGTAVKDDNGNITYTPDAGYEGDDSFEYTISDGNDGEDTAKVSITVLEIVENADDLCYADYTYEGMMCMDMGICQGGIGCTTSIPLVNIGDTSLSDTTVFYDENGIGGTMAGDCDVSPDGECTQESGIDMGPAGLLGTATTFEFADDIDVEQEDTEVSTTAKISMSCLNSDNLYGTYIKDDKLYRGNLKPCEPGYCKANNLPDGFNIIDPDGGDDNNSYEIFCDSSTYLGKEFIALPIKNDYNNFVFKDDDPQVNYYEAADDAKADDANNEFYFLQIKIDKDDHTIRVVADSFAKGSAKNEGYFSNLNLIATPFAVDWSDTKLSNCDVDKLRIGANNQAIKINTLDYTKGRCKVEYMTLKLLDDYQYLRWDDINNGEEVLEETCREIFETVPDQEGYLPTDSSDGHYWIDPDQGGRDEEDNLTDPFRPIVAGCQYQSDIGEAWTFITALDGKVTNSKNDIHTMEEVKADPSIYHDTCSQLGLLFYVPNTKETFDRVRKYLRDDKAQWINYTGTIREKYKMYKNDPDKEYYIAGEGYNEIWPYGPFGLYFPQNGNKDEAGNYWNWRNANGDDTKTGNMSGRCMNSGEASGASACNELDHEGIYQNMGEAGWRTTLQDMVEDGLENIHNGEEFWIADVGAGNYMTKYTSGSPEYSVTGPGQGGDPDAHRTPYYEPNGNYTKEAWLNFIADSEGNIYHNDDNNDFYAYYDYMCMAWDNYKGVARIEPIKGPFTAIDEDTNNQPYDGQDVSELDLNIKTKIVKKEMSLQIVNFDRAYSDEDAKVSKDINISAGVFLGYVNSSDEGDTYSEIHYFGDIGPIESNPELPINNNGYYTLQNSDWTNNEKIINEARRKMQVRFKYCQLDATDWTSCWNSGNNGGCKANCNPDDSSCNCQYVTSDFFAVRPKFFEVEGLSADKDLLKAGESYSFTTILARDEENATTDRYDQISDNIEINATKYLHTGEKDENGELNGNLSGNRNADFDFEDGNATGDYQFTFNDVAVLAIEIYDDDWTSVDSDDTPNTCTDEGRRICAKEQYVTFIPDHFELKDVNVSNNRSGMNYTYLDKDLNISAKLEVTLEALTASNEITKNFKSGDKFYENPVAVTIKVPLKDADGETLVDLNGKALTSVEHNITQDLLGFGGDDEDGTHTIAYNESDTSQRLMFNYSRTYNGLINPFNINGTDIELNVTSTYTGNDGSTEDIVGGNTADDKNVTFVFAKASPSRLLYDNVTEANTNTPIMVKIYCDKFQATSLCYGIDTINGQTNDSKWWIATTHDATQNDGNISVQVESISPNDGQASLSQANADITVDGISTDIDVKADNDVRPMLVNIQLDNSGVATNDWLIYNPNSDILVPNTFYKVRFVGTMDWAGHGDTGRVIDIETATHKNNKLGW